MPLRTILKDPLAVLEYGFDWRQWLANGEYISDYTLTATAGITIQSHQNASGVITAILTGGTAGVDYTLDYYILTTAARRDARSLLIRVLER